MPWRLSNQKIILKRHIFIKACAHWVHVGRDFQPALAELRVQCLKSGVEVGWKWRVSVTAQAPPCGTTSGVVWRGRDLLLWGVPEQGLQTCRGPEPRLEWCRRRSSRSSSWRAGLCSTAGELGGRPAELGLTLAPCSLCHLSPHVREAQGPGSTQASAALLPEGQFPSLNVSSHSSCLWENWVPDEKGEPKKRISSEIPS